MSLFDVFQVLNGPRGPRTRIVASGGGALSQVWRQILADTFGHEVVTRQHAEDASALGAGIVAGVATGTWKTVEEAVARIADTSSLQPNPATASLYRERFEIYRGLYPALTQSFEAIARASG